MTNSVAALMAGVRELLGKLLDSEPANRAAFDDAMSDVGDFLALCRSGALKLGDEKTSSQEGSFEGGKEDGGSCPKWQLDFLSQQSRVKPPQASGPTPRAASAPPTTTNRSVMDSWQASE